LPNRHPWCRSRVASSGSPHNSSGSDVQRMNIPKQALVKGIRGIDLRTVLTNHEVVLEAETTDTWSAIVGLQVRGHSHLECHWGGLRRDAEMGRLPGVDATPVAQRAEDELFARCLNYLGVGIPRDTGSCSTVERVVALLVEFDLLGRWRDIAA